MLGFFCLILNWYGSMSIMSDAVCQGEKMAFKLESLSQNEIYGRNQSISTHVFKILRNAIVTLKLLPGNSLSEADIAKQLGVSRQPVREAFIQLSRIGLLNIVPQKGSFIVKISERDVGNAQFIREAIEVAIVRRACDHATRAHVDRLPELIAAQNKAAAETDQERFLEMDDAFHHAVAECADCLYGWQIVEGLKAQMDRVRFLSLPPEVTALKKIITQHRRIVKAIMASDQDAAGRAMQTHLREILVSLPRLAERHQELFSQDSCINP
jgi:DNA-binding GntR family transcriptional regulator